MDSVRWFHGALAIASLCVACTSGPATPSVPQQSVAPASTGQKVLSAITGRVTDQATGNAVANATIQITDGPTTGRVAADASGGFNLTSLEAGNYRVQTSATGYDLTVVEIAVAGSTTLNVSLHATPVAPPPLAPPAAKTNTLTGTVISSLDGRPVSGATIQIADATSHALIAKTTTDGSGRYAFNDLAVRTAVFLEASANGFATFSNGAVALSEHAAYDVTLVRDPAFQYFVQARGPVSLTYVDGNGVTHVINAGEAYDNPIPVRPVPKPGARLSITAQLGSGATSVTVAIMQGGTSIASATTQSASAPATASTTASY